MGANKPTSETGSDRPKREHGGWSSPRPHLSTRVYTVLVSASCRGPRTGLARREAASRRRVSLTRPQTEGRGVAALHKSPWAQVLTWA